LVMWRRWMRTALIRRGGWIDTNHDHHALVRELVYLLALEAGICGFESHPGHQV
jgi:hypothetical protein